MINKDFCKYTSILSIAMVVNLSSLLNFSTLLGCMGLILQYSIVVHRVKLKCYYVGTGKVHKKEVGVQATKESCTRDMEESRLQRKKRDRCRRIGHACNGGKVS